MTVIAIVIALIALLGVGHLSKRLNETIATSTKLAQATLVIARDLNKVKEELKNQNARGPWLN